MGGRGGSDEDTLMDRLVGRGSRKGTTWFGRVGDVTQRPVTWAGVALALALAGGRRGRRAALRGGVGYAIAALAHLPLKALVDRDHPKGAFRLNLGPFTSSFPSGHAASDLAFVFGVAQELPLLLLPLSGATLAGHWTLLRKRSHYPSDILVGGTLGLVVAAILWKLWPPGEQPPLRAPAEAPAAESSAGESSAGESSPGAASSPPVPAPDSVPASAPVSP